MKLLLVGTIAVLSLAAMVSANYKFGSFSGYAPQMYSYGGFGGGGFGNGFSAGGFGGIFGLLIFLFVFILLISILFGSGGIGGIGDKRYTSSRSDYGGWEEGHRAH